METNKTGDTCGEWQRQISKPIRLAAWRRRFGDSVIRLNGNETREKPFADPARRPGPRAGGAGETESSPGQLEPARRLPRKPGHRENDRGAFDGTHFYSRRFEKTRENI